MIMIYGNILAIFINKKMTNTKKIIGLRVHISMSVGLGHFSRLENLASNLNQKVFWLVSGDINLIKKCLSKKKFFYIKHGDNKKSQILEFLKNKKINKIIVDLGYISNLKKGNIYRILNFYLKNKLKLISFDDARQKRNLSHISIISGVDKKKYFFNSKESKIFYGKEYNFSIKTKKIYKRSKFYQEVKNIFISISGTDQKDLGFKILKLLVNENFKFTLVCSKKLTARPSTKSFIKKNIDKVKFLHLISKQKMMNEINKSHFCICGPGIIKFDLSKLHKSFILILRRNQINDIQIQNFIGLRNCKIIKINNIANDHIKTSILEYIKNDKLRHKHYLNTKKFFMNKIFLKKQTKLIKEIINL